MLLELLVKSYSTEDRVQCNKAFLEIHHTAYESLGHSTPPGEQKLAGLHAAVLCRLGLQRSTFPRNFEAATSRHDQYMAYRGRRHKLLTRLWLQQDEGKRDILIKY